MAEREFISPGGESKFQVVWLCSHCWDTSCDFGWINQAFTIKGMIWAESLLWGVWLRVGPDNGMNGWVPLSMGADASIPMAGDFSMKQKSCFLSSCAAREMSGDSLGASLGCLGRCWCSQQRWGPQGESGEMAKGRSLPLSGWGTQRLSHACLRGYSEMWLLLLKPRRSPRSTEGQIGDWSGIPVTILKTLSEEG